MKTNFLMVVSAIALTACGGGGGDSSSPAVGNSPAPATSSGGSPLTTLAAPARPVAHSDAEIARLLFTDGERTPGGFYMEETPPAVAHVSTAHLKNSDVAASNTPAPTNLHELCTDDWNQALEWSEDVAVRLPTYGDLVETNANPRFFEFVRVPRSNPQARARQRVFRCTYVDRSSADIRTQEGAGGVLQQRPLVESELRQLVEYLWQFTAYNNFGNAVLASSDASSGSTIAHDLVMATLTRASTQGACDRIDVVRWRHAADATTGNVTRSLQTLWHFEARESTAGISVCDAS